MGMRKWFFSRFPNLTPKNVSESSAPFFRWKHNTHKKEPVLADRLQLIQGDQAFSRARVRVVISQTSAGP